MQTPSLVIAGTHSGCGKTTVALGMMAALKQRGLRVQPFKVGPDFIDPGHHQRITGRASHNLDGWMMDPETNLRVFRRYARDADIAVVEGVMGLFDGFSGSDETGSTAQMAKWLKAPVVLVIDARSMARSAGAIALGFSRFDPELAFAGVVFNRVGSPGHAAMLKEALRSGTALSLLGCLPARQDLDIPSRHLGLVTDEDLPVDGDRPGRLAAWIEGHVDLDTLLSGLGPEDLPGPRPGSRKAPANPTDRPVRIGVAMDEAFCFYYPENLRLLEEAGAELLPFSPLRTEHLPEGLHGLLLGGGYPELHCAALSRNRNLMREVKAFAREGGAVYGECGGFMYLMEEVRDLEGRPFPMTGVFPFSAQMEPRLCSLGYREIVTREESLLGPPGTRVKGHEFHYSRILGEKGVRERIYRVRTRKGTEALEGYGIKNTLGSYVHQHWGSNPEVAAHLVRSCRKE